MLNKFENINNDSIHILEALELMNKIIDEMNKSDVNNKRKYMFTNKENKDTIIE